MHRAEMEEPPSAESAERLRGELSDKLGLIRHAGGTQRALIDEANRLAETLDQLRRRVEVLRGPLAVIAAHDGAAHPSPAGRASTPGGP